MPISPEAAHLTDTALLQREAGPRKARPYIFLGQTTSLCETCLVLVPAKIVEEGSAVYYLKRCAEHGVQTTLVSSEAAYWKRCRDFLKPGDVPLKFHTRIDQGCPYDCGLCPDHEQHSCLALIEVNEHCNLTCPTCFASSSPQKGGQRSLAEVESMLDLLVESEGKPDLLQLSGGEPTLHPQILDILRAARARPIRHVMLNTNGIRIATDPDFVAALGEMKRGFEVYLQFDALSAQALRTIRGADLRQVRERALQALDEAGISTTLVCVIRKGVNDAEIGDVLRYAQGWSCVRGVTFQPVQDVGRNDGFDPRENRIVLSEIRRAIIDQLGRLRRGRPDPVTVQSRGDLDRVWDAGGGRGARADASFPGRGPGPGGAELGHVRKQSRDAQALGGTALALLRRAAIGERAARGVVLPADGRGAAGDRLRPGVPGDRGELSRPLQFLPRRGQALVHPFHHR